jgi:hypothetical protein
MLSPSAHLLLSGPSLVSASVRGGEGEREKEREARKKTARSIFSTTNFQTSLLTVGDWDSLSISFFFPASICLEEQRTPEDI